MKVKSLIKEVFSSPIGDVDIISDNKGLVSIEFSWDGQSKLPQKPAQYYDITSDFSNDNKSYSSVVVSQLEEYFSGKRQKFSLEFSLHRGTEFQRLVWSEMQKIPFGETVTYAEIARKIGRPKAARAVGMACNKNPVCIIVPCHRVVGSSGALTGYAGGLAKKQWLLTHEGCA